MVGSFHNACIYYKVILFKNNFSVLCIIYFLVLLKVEVLYKIFDLRKLNTKNNWFYVLWSLGFNQSKNL